MVSLAFQLPPQTAKPQSWQKLLEAFDALPQPANPKVLAEIPRRAAREGRDLPTGDALTAAADALFLELDRKEELRPPA